MPLPRIALVSATAARGLDDDMAPLLDAFAAAGADASAVDWDDDRVEWPRHDMAILRSTWNYVQRLPDFLAFVDRAAARTARPSRNGPPASAAAPGTASWPRAARRTIR